MTAAAGQPTATRDLVLTRVFDAPPDLVFRMWTDPKHMAQWWGPHHFTNPVCEMDVRPGGAMRIDMTAPDGTVYPLVGTFQEVVAGKRLVFMAIAQDRDGNPLLESLTTVTFEDLGGKTKLTVDARAVGISPLAPQMLAGMEAGWTQSLERLEAITAQQ
jgi:uncharacterized protein YndB with AHSA1/START domain